ncbi:hypothetical protein [Streptomyces sp. CB01881]|uniref:hypothetical protein n=1 Tax=Streptomyces sp. CB01881 TaxID=2078691 RepID=UPI001F11E237|nr:hypothetical protein [Streptomyces sp. CB01881]
MVLRPSPLLPEATSTTGAGRVSRRATASAGSRSPCPWTGSASASGPVSSRVERSDR